MHNQRVPTIYHTFKKRLIRVAISKFRLSSHSFMTERGRWCHPKLEVERRVCAICNVLEDEYHVVASCTRFSDLRKKFVSQNLDLLVNPSMFKLLQFLNWATEKGMKMFGIFCPKVPLIMYEL